MPDTEIKALHITRAQAGAIASGIILGIGMVISVIMYIDDEFDDQRAIMLAEFEHMAKANATSADDLNFRIGYHTALKDRCE